MTSGEVLVGPFFGPRGAARWGACADGEAMMDAARRAGVDRRSMTLAACACARQVVILFGPGHNSTAMRAIRLAELCVKGTAPRNLVEAQRNAALWAAESRLDGWASRATVAAAVASETAYHNKFGSRAVTAVTLIRVLFQDAAKAGQDVGFGDRSAGFIRGQIPYERLLSAAGVAS